MKTMIETMATKCVPKKHKKKTTPWLSKDAVKIVEDRRKARSAGNKDQVRILNNAFQKQARLDKEEFLHGLCKEMEEECKKGRTRELFSKVRTITGKFTTRMGSMKSGNSNVIDREEGVKNRWREYTESLYSVDKSVTEKELTSQEYVKEPEVLQREVEWAIKQLKDNKAPGWMRYPLS